jgi:hypothetical protein
MQGAARRDGGAKTFDLATYQHRHDGTLNLKGQQVATVEAAAHGLVH